MLVIQPVLDSAGLYLQPFSHSDLFCTFLGFILPGPLLSLLSSSLPSLSLSKVGKAIPLDPAYKFGTLSPALVTLPKGIGQTQLGHPIASSRLGICRLGSDACAGVASVLQVNTCLRELDLSFNDLGDRGLWLLGEGLRHQTCRLQKLW